MGFADAYRKASQVLVEQCIDEPMFVKHLAEGRGLPMIQNCMCLMYCQVGRYY